MMDNEIKPDIKDFVQDVYEKYMRRIASKTLDDDKQLKAVVFFDQLTKPYMRGRANHD